MFSTETVQLKSLFLPNSGDKKEKPSAEHSGKVSVALFGGHWPSSDASQHRATSASGGGADSLPPATAGSGDAMTVEHSNQLSDYIAHTSLLYPSSPSSIVTILRSGAVEVFNMTDSHKGPYVQHKIPAPEKSLASKLGLATASSSSTSSSSSSSSGGHPLHTEGFAKSKITSASLIPAEIALRQRLEEVGYITPGPCPLLLLNSHVNDGASGGGAGGGAGSSFPAANYSPPGSTRENPIDQHLRAMRQERVDGTSTSDSSAATLGGDNNSSAQAMPRFSAEAWQRTIRSLWRGVVGTSNGEVMVFDGVGYTLAFRCLTTAPVLQVASVLLPDEETLPSSSSARSNKNRSTNNTNSSKSPTNSAATPQHQRSTNGYGVKRTSSLSAVSLATIEVMTAAARGAGSVLSNGGRGGSGGGGGYGSTAEASPPPFYSVGFVTLQKDGSVLCWRRMRRASANVANSANSGGGNAVINGMGAFSPITVQSPSMFAKVKTIHITHRFTIPMVLSNAAPRLPWSIGSFIDEAHGVGGPRGDCRSLNAGSLTAHNYNDANGGAGTDDDNNNASNGPDPSQQQPLSSRAAHPHLRSLQTFYSWFSPAGAVPEPLPLLSVILSPENGLGGNVSVRDVFGRRVDEDVMLDGKLKRTTAMASDGTSAVFAREKNLFIIDYTQREIRRIHSCNAVITNVCYQHPIVVAGCENGNIYVIGANNGKRLAEYCTYGSSSVRHLAFHYQSMLVTIVDEYGGEVEVLALPSEFLRYGAMANERYETRQTVAMKYSIIAAETSNSNTANQNNMASKRNALEQKLLAQLSIPNCVQQYLSYTHILK